MKWLLQVKQAVGGRHAFFNFGGVEITESGDNHNLGGGRNRPAIFSGPDTVATGRHSNINKGHGKLIFVRPYGPDSILPLAAQGQIKQNGR